MDRQQIARCVEQVAAFRASGPSAQVWSEANDVPMRSIASWCAHSRRWQAKLDGIEFVPSAPPPKSTGFVAARVAPNVAPNAPPAS
ncbi:MAG TPA: hypothetical protein VNU71_10475, partial [Burkholderiaceae bacterium]|nr:hypothetical protein [Burkholderiaceae bacterium]